MNEKTKKLTRSKNVTTKKNTQVMVTSAILLALGLVLHMIIPSAGIKPDFLLACMFIAITLTDNKKQVFAITIVSGILTAMTTNFPAGQLPSMIDKFLSGFLFLMIYRSINNRKSINTIHIGIISAISTLFSGVIFLTSVFILGKIMGLVDVMTIFERGFYPMITLIVLPTSIANGFFAGLLNKIINLKKYWLYS